MTDETDALELGKHSHYAVAALAGVAGMWVGTMLVPDVFLTTEIAMQTGADGEPYLPIVPVGTFHVLISALALGFACWQGALAFGWSVETEEDVDDVDDDRAEVEP